MNAAFLLFSSAALAGADPAPTPPAAPVVVSGTGCTNCGGSAYTGGYSSGCCDSTKPGLFDRLKGHMGGFGKKSIDCGCAPVPAPCSGCGTSVADRPNLFDNLKARWGSKSCGGRGHAAACDTCGAAPLMSAPPATGTTPPTTTAPAPGSGTTPPQPMPRPTGDGKGGNTGGLPSVPPVPPVTGASLTGTSPY